MIARILVAAALAGLALAACSRPTDKAQVSRGQVLAYLDDHPEVINEASQRYELKRRKELMAESAKAIALRKAALERDPRDYVANPNGKVGVSLRASEAAMAAGRVGKYQAVHDAMMAMPSLDDAGIARALRENGLDPASTVADADDLRHIQQVRDLAKAIGANGTPTYVVGDTLIAGNSMDQLALAIEQAKHAKG